MYYCIIQLSSFRGASVFSKLSSVHATLRLLTPPLRLHCPITQVVRIGDRFRYSQGLP